MYLYLHKLLELMRNMFPITWLRNYMIVGQNQPQTLKHHSCQNDLHVYHVFYSTVTGLKNNETLHVQKMSVANFIDSFISSQGPNISKLWRQCAILVNFTDNFGQF